MHFVVRLFPGRPAAFPDKDIFVFVSHKHADHYNPAIWELEKQYPNVYYVLYQDVSEKKGETFFASPVVKTTASRGSK